MVSKQTVTIAVIAIVMLVVGIGIGYGIAGTRVTTNIMPTPTQRVVEAIIRQVIQVGSWRLAVLDVKETTYIKTKTLLFDTWSYYQAPKGTKIVIIRLRIENAGIESTYLFVPTELMPILVTDANKMYNNVYTYNLQYIRVVSKEIEEKAVEYNELNIFPKVDPGSYVEVDIMFLIPQTEKPAKLIFNCWQSPFEPQTIVIKLS